MILLTFLSLVFSATSVNPDDFYMSIHPIRREVNPATARPAPAHLLVDHLFSVDLELHFVENRGSPRALSSPLFFELDISTRLLLYLGDDPPFVIIMDGSQLISKMIEESSEDAFLFCIHKKHLGFQIMGCIIL